MTFLRRHARFLLALIFGAALAGVSYAMHLPGLTAALIGVDTFFLGYLGLALQMTRHSSAADLRQRAEEDDEGILLILILVLLAVCVSLAAIFQVLSNPEQDLPTTLLSLAAVPLGWAVVHALAAYHYAHLFYAGPPGLRFAQTDAPGPWDFMYHAFAIGTACAVSDVVVISTAMRRLVLLHTVGSFFFNTVIVALAVNAALVLGGAAS